MAISSSHRTTGRVAASPPWPLRAGSALAPCPAPERARAGTSAADRRARRGRGTTGPPPAPPPERPRPGGEGEKPEAREGVVEADRQALAGDGPHDTAHLVAGRPPHRGCDAQHPVEE